MTAEHATRLALAVPEAEVVAFPDAMHGYVMEEPERLADVVVPFLTR